MITPAQQALLDDLNKRWEGTDELLAERMGIEYLDLDPNHLVATVPVSGNRQP